MKLNLFQKDDQKFKYQTLRSILFRPKNQSSYQVYVSFAVYSFLDFLLQLAQSLRVLKHDWFIKYFSDVSGI